METTIKNLTHLSYASLKNSFQRWIESPLNPKNDGLRKYGTYERALEKTVEEAFKTRILDVNNIFELTYADLDKLDEIFLDENHPLSKLNSHYAHRSASNACKYFRIYLKQMENQLLAR